MNRYETHTKNKENRLGIIVRMDNSGLGNQTRALCEMLKPHRIMVVDSTPFNGNAQHPEWYQGHEAVFTKGWPTEIECSQFMTGLTHVVTAETVYNNHIFWLAKKHKVKLFIQPNWEFLDHLIRAYPQPDKWLMPSYWHLEDMQRKFKNTVYLPPPMLMDKFTSAREDNLKHRKIKNFLHIVGKRAAHDRNGTEDIVEALKHTNAKFTLTVRSQMPLEDYGELVNDPRVRVEISNLEDEADMYKGFDAMILPRRYAGLSLPMNEALASALPVIMPDISPNNKVLPHDWLVPARLTGSFIARTSIEIYTTDPIELAAVIDRFANMKKDEISESKERALEIAAREYSSESLLPRYKQILGLDI